ncbi:type VI secretion system protein IglI family protein [Fangia hongkongensis]|uniref:type VI secretion system protein IglI family protein n=2 Tax=Fangia hongkongensis TaxID=270495 RepID=UPI0003737B2B|nr:type VI secretion system protein IglI family protein [Fangia hongkongensis]
MNTIEKLQQIEFEEGRMDLFIKSEAANLAEKFEFDKLYDLCLESFQEEQVLDTMLWFYLFFSEIKKSLKTNNLIETIECYENYFTTHNYFNQTTDSFAKQLYASLKWFYESFESLLTKKSIRLSEENKQALISIIEDWRDCFNEKVTQESLRETLQTQHDKITQMSRLYIQLKVQKAKKVEKEKADQEEDLSVATNKANAVDNLKKTCSNLLSETGSFHWQQLMEKVVLLTTLLQENKLFESAILYQDVEKLFKNFDPRVYFPKAFEGLYKEINQARLSEMLEIIQTQQEGVQWQLAKMKYQMSPESLKKEKLSYNVNVQDAQQNMQSMYQPPERLPDMEEGEGNYQDEAFQQFLNT